MSVGPSLSLRGYYSLLKQNPNFRRLWFAQLISGSGDWFYSVAIYDLLFQLTGSAKPVAVAVVLQILPIFFAGPSAGAVNDRLSRRSVMIATDVIRAFLVLGMLFIDSVDEIWILYLLLAAEVATAAFFESGRNASIPNVVSREQIPTANAIGSTTWSVTVTAGAAAGGVAVAFLGRETAFLANSLTFLLSAYFIKRTSFRETHAEGLGPVGWRDVLGYRPMIEGFEYVIGHWRLALLLTLKFGLGILGSRVVLTAVIGSSEFPVAGKGSLGMSLLYMFQGVGSLLGPLLIGRFALDRQPAMRRLILLGYLMAAASYMIFSQVTTLTAAALTMVGAHAGGALVWVFSTTLLQLHTEDRYRGRVFAADLGLFMVTASAATYTCGWAIDQGVAARTMALLVGVAMLLPAGTWAISMRRRWEDA